MLHGSYNEIERGRLGAWDEVDVTYSTTDPMGRGQEKREGKASLFIILYTWCVCGCGGRGEEKEEKDLGKDQVLRVGHMELASQGGAQGQSLYEGRLGSQGRGSSGRASLSYYAAAAQVAT